MNKTLIQLLSSIPTEEILDLELSEKASNALVVSRVTEGKGFVDIYLDTGGTISCPVHNLEGRVYYE